MNILEVNKSCFKDCFYSFSRVDVCSCPVECFPLPIVSPSSWVSTTFFIGFHFSVSLFPVLTHIIVKCVFSFTISHRRSLPTFPWVGSIVFLQRGSCPVGETLPSFLAVEQLLPARPSRKKTYKKKRMEPLPHRRNPGSGRSIFNELLFISA